MSTAPGLNNARFPTELPDCALKLTGNYEPGGHRPFSGSGSTGLERNTDSLYMTVSDSRKLTRSSVRNLGIATRFFALSMALSHIRAMQASTQQHLDQKLTDSRLDLVNIRYIRDLCVHIVRSQRKLSVRVIGIKQAEQCPCYQCRGAFHLYPLVRDSQIRHGRDWRWETFRIELRNYKGSQTSIRAWLILHLREPLCGLALTWITF